MPYAVFTNDELGKVAFSPQNPPIGKVAIRNQHWKKPECEQTAIISPNMDVSCFDQSSEQLMTPLDMYDDKILTYL